ncbi:hypothetical protein [Helicobacter sp. MIT 01-3238]|uniref:hypothetical protein n=1 Tax=Helicobacter sp. MIT 01-3238 TaxID=398627 RepID=UPI000E1EAA12|nr:hypothetical protein [Helicobacter sp. MIT 01-3238]RDU52341.1 hypothetical protein CQA40_07710 [Helicobacter sp. MIT 01-3238]
MQNSDKLQCKGCKKSKPQNEFYLVDGGLGIEGIENLRFEICKECIKAYNTKNGTGKNFCYLLWQHIACYYGAKEFIAKNSDKNSCDRKLLKSITSKIDNGYKSYRDDSLSLQMALQNFISLFDKFQKGGFKKASPKRQKRVFDILQNAQTDLENTIKEKILQEDYQTFKQFKQTQGVKK